MKYSIKTFGCKVNTYDSALIQKTLNHTGYEKDAPSEVCSTASQDMKDKGAGQALNHTGYEKDAPSEVCSTASQDMKDKGAGQALNHTGYEKDAPSEVCSTASQDMKDKGAGQALNHTGYEKDAPSEVCSTASQDMKDKGAGQALNHTGLRVAGDKVNVPSVHIVNTCAVTEEAVKSAQSYIRNYRKKNPLDPIVVTGCAAQVETEKFSTLKEVDIVVANSHKAELANILNFAFGKSQTSPSPSKKGSLTFNPAQKTDEESNGLSQEYGKGLEKQKVFKSSIFKKSPLGKEGGVESGHTRLFLKIQDGCDSFCTFCIIPFARGKSRSLAPEDLVRSVQEHYDQGVREVVLTGVHIGDYRFPNNEKKGLSDLVEILLKKTNMPRIRLSSLEPPELNDKLLDLFTDSRMCSHFHLSIQSAHSEVLKRMKRKYTAEEVGAILIKIHKKIPQAFVGMDLIAGFAGETKKQFEETYSRLKIWPWTKIHVFPYSPRRDTYAERAYTSWPRSLIKKRAGFLRRLSEDRLNQQRTKQVGAIKAVLPLKYKNHIGLSRDYWTVLLPSLPHFNSNKEIGVRISSVDEKTGYLQGAFS